MLRTATKAMTSSNATKAAINANMIWDLQNNLSDHHHCRCASRWRGAMRSNFGFGGTSWWNSFLYIRYLVATRICTFCLISMAILMHHCTLNSSKVSPIFRQIGQNPYTNKQLITDDLSLDRPDPWGTEDTPQSQAPLSYSIAAPSAHN